LVDQITHSSKIVEGKVVAQETIIGQDGNIYMKNQIEIYRVLKGDVGFDMEVITEGGVYGDLMQVVTPSSQMLVGDYGLMVLSDDSHRSLTSVAQAFYPIDERTNTVYGLKDESTREGLYELVGRMIGTNAIALRRVPADHFTSTEQQNDRTAPSVSGIAPLQVTAGTQTVVNITGQGFGPEQGDGRVAFHNADDGGQSFVTLQPGPHYLSWSDTEIELFVPSATVYNTTVAGTGSVRVVTTGGASAESLQQLTVKYATSEVVYSEQLNNTMLVGIESGGYSFRMNSQLAQLTSGGEMVSQSLSKWACNTGVNFNMNSEAVNVSSWAHDDINLIGMSGSGQLPSYLLGKTVTTFSGCGTGNGIQWNLIEVDILLNSDIDWWLGEGQPMADKFDLSTAIIHELGHAHLLQHNNNTDSPMYFQLKPGSMRRTLHPQADIEGGDYVTTQGVEASSTCSAESHQYYDFASCNVSLLNGIEEDDRLVEVVYPNPFSNEIVVTLNEKARYDLIDAVGRSVFSGTANSGRLVIDTDDLVSGVYFLSIHGASDREVHRLLKN
jgi:hypothetical protein